MTSVRSTKTKWLIALTVVVGLGAAAYYLLPFLHRGKVVELPAGHYAITVDGVTAAALSSRRDAQDTLDLLRHAYDKPGTKAVGESTFKEKVSIIHRLTAAGVVYNTPKEACQALTEPVEPAIIHTIVVGDRAVDLAKQYNVTLDKIQGLNPLIDVALLNEGDQILIRPAKRLITVLNRSLVTQTVDIMPPSDMARLGSRQTGKRTMKVLQTCENGTPTKQEVISQITTWERPRRLHYRTRRTDRTAKASGQSAKSPTLTPVSNTTPTTTP